MKVDEIKAKLDELKIPYDPSAKKADLEALLPEGSQNSTGDLDIEVGDPLLLRPVELPLVVKLPEGQEWKNEEQKRFAAILNGYAYRNPKKWEKKKDVLIAQLKQLASEPELFNTLAGIADPAANNISYNNKLIQTSADKN